MRHVHPLFVTCLLLSAPAWAKPPAGSAAPATVDGDRQAPPSPGDVPPAPVPWTVPNLQIQTWVTLWDQDEDPQADAGGYGDPEHDSGFTLRRARLGLSGGWKWADYNLRFGTSIPYDTLSPTTNLVDVIDAWARASFQSTAGVTRVSVGLQRVPFSREQQFSSNDLAFQETAVSTQWLSPNRDIGALVQHDHKYFTMAAGIYNGNGTIFGNADNGMMAATRFDFHAGGDTYRTNAADSAVGVGAGYVYNHTPSTDTHMVAVDALGRYKGLTLMVEGEMNILQPVEAPDVLPPDVPEVTRRLGGFVQLSYYREVGIGAVEPAVRFAYFDDAEHLKDNGDVGDLHAGLTWREPLPFIDIGAGYIHRIEFQGTPVGNDTVRMWVGFRYPSRKYRPFDILESLRSLGAKPLQQDGDGVPDGAKGKKPKRGGG